MSYQSDSPLAQGPRMVQPYLSSGKERESISNYPAPEGVNPSLYKNLIACIRGYNLTTGPNPNPSADMMRGQDAKKVLQALLQVPDATLGTRSTGASAVSAGLGMARHSASYASGLAAPYAQRMSAPYASRMSSLFGTRGKGGKRKRKGKRTRRYKK